MADTVAQRGTDTSGRPILASDYLWSWWQGRVYDLGFHPTIVQGSWMERVPGGGADASAGYHDRGGCLDLRVWDLTPGQVTAVIRNLRANGAAAWVRDATHGGMDPHIHLLLGTDTPTSAGAAWQWFEYLSGRDGLATRGADYHWRPDPLVAHPPKGSMMPTSTEIAAAVWAERLPRTDGSGKDAKASVLLAQAQARAGSARALAAALRREGVEVDQETIEAALRAVLGTLDEEE